MPVLGLVRRSGRLGMDGLSCAGGRNRGLVTREDESGPGKPSAPNVQLKHFWGSSAAAL